MTTTLPQTTINDRALKAYDLVVDGGGLETRVDTAVNRSGWCQEKLLGPGGEDGLLDQVASLNSQVGILNEAVETLKARVTALENG